MTNTNQQQRSTHTKRSLLLHRINDFSANSSTAVFIALVTFLFVVFGLAIEFPRWWVDVLEIVGTSVTLVMVFVIQHTHARQQAAIQLKLDEIVRSLPGASNKFINVEKATEDELEAQEEHHVGLRQTAVNNKNSAD